MLNVRFVVHGLRVKWMKHLALDRGFSWSRFAWSNVMRSIPSDLIQGMRCITETTLQKMDPFYASILWSYALVNDLFFQKNKGLELPVNLWCHPKSKQINYALAEAGFCTVADLPLKENKIDFGWIQTCMLDKKSVFLPCYCLQSKFGKEILAATNIQGSHLVLEQLVQQSKKLLQDAHSKRLSLSKWEKFFGLMPLSGGEVEMVYRHMLQKCKYTKF